jgi:hypothetical protein
MTRTFSVLLIFLSSLLSSQEQHAALEGLHWILGNWERQNAKPGQTHQEKWWKVSDNELRGMGVVTAGKDTVFVEKLGIVLEKEKVYYVAEVPENPAPVYFAFTYWDSRSFVSENPEHDAPKKIAYKLEGEVMTAAVSWDNGGFQAVFRKIK